MHEVGTVLPEAQNSCPLVHSKSQLGVDSAFAAVPPQGQTPEPITAVTNEVMPEPSMAEAEAR